MESKYCEADAAGFTGSAAENERLPSSKREFEDYLIRRSI
jgi:hypothetical protein